MKFNETKWIKGLFLVSSMQSSLKEMEKIYLSDLLLKEKKQASSQLGIITASALTTILKSHYHKIDNRESNATFTIPVTNIIRWIYKAIRKPAKSIRNSPNYTRYYDTGTDIGYDELGLPATGITVITNASGEVITAFPGPDYPNRKKKKN